MHHKDSKAKIRKQLKVQNISWDQETVDHIAGHGVSPEEVEQVLFNDYDKSEERSWVQTPLTFDLSPFTSRLLFPAEYLTFKMRPLSFPCGDKY